MAVYEVRDRRELSDALESAQPGDCLRVPSLSAAASGSREALSLISDLRARGVGFASGEECIDTQSVIGRAIADFCAALCELDRRELLAKRRSGIERAREDGRYKGRKPIAVDEALFDSVVALWRQGAITAREAMARLKLKPNTFYRRIKEQEETKMKDYKKVEKEIRSGIKEAARQSRQDLRDLKEQVKAEAEEVKQAAGDALDLHGVEKELRRERRSAESEYNDAVRQMKKDVEAEAKELKKLVRED